MASLFDEVIAAATTEFGENRAEVARVCRRRSQRRETALAELRGLAHGTDGARDGGLRARPREVRRAGRAARLRRSDQRTTSSRSASSSSPRTVRRELSSAQADRRLEIGVRGRRRHQVASIRPTSTRRSASIATAMDEARQYIIDHDIATMPPGEQLSVIETPEYLRNVMPFAAYFSAPKFAHRRGPAGHLHRHAVSRRRRRARCASTTSRRSTTRRSTRRIPATTCS